MSPFMYTAPTISVLIAIICNITFVQSQQDLTMLKFLSDFASLVNAGTVHIEDNGTLALRFMTYDENWMWSKTCSSYMHGNFQENRGSVILSVHLRTFDYFQAHFENVLRSTGSEPIVWMINETRSITRLQIIPPDTKLFLVNITTAKNGVEPLIQIKYAYTDYTRNKVVNHYFGNWTPSTGIKTSIEMSKCCYNLTDYVVNVVYMQMNNADSVFAWGLSEDMVYNKGWSHGWSSNPEELPWVDYLLEESGNSRLGKIYNVTEYGGIYDEHATGMFHLLSTKEADVAVSCLSTTTSRQKLATFGLGLSLSGIDGLYQKREESFFLFFSKTFSVSSWNLIISACVSLLLANVAFNWLAKSDEIGTDVFVKIGTLFNQDSGYDRKETSWRIFHLTMLGLGFLLVAFFGSKIVEEKATSDSRKTFHNLAELAKDDEYYPIIHRGTSTHANFESSSDPEYKLIWNKIKRDMKKHLLANTNEIEDRLKREKCVFIGDATYVHYLRSKDKTLAIMGINQQANWGSFFYGKHFSAARIFDLGILEIHQSGISKRLFKPFLPRDNIAVQTIPNEISVADVRLSFVMLGIGILISGIILACEYLSTLSFISHRCRRFFHFNHF